MTTSEESLSLTESTMLGYRPASSRTIVTQKSISINNELKREPTYRVPCVHVREQTLFRTNANERISSMPEKNNVARLCQQFNHFNTPDTSSSTKHYTRTSITQMNTSTSANLLPLQAKQTTSIRTEFAIVHQPTSVANKLTPRIYSSCFPASTTDSLQALRTYVQRLASSNNKSLDGSDFYYSSNSLPLMSEPSNQTAAITCVPKHSYGPSSVFIFSQVNGVPDTSVGEPNSPGDLESTRIHSATTSSGNRDEDIQAKQAMKLRRCLEEAYATEENYTKILFALVVKLPSEVKKMCEKDENLLKTFNQLFQPLLNALQTIYKLHHRTILPQMAKCLTGHRQGLMWSIIEENFQSIEHLYQAYYFTFDEIQQKMEEFCRAHALINEAMLHTQEYLGNLYPITQLNCANQRLLRYLLLMEAYMKNLDPTSAEYEYTSFIHDELERIAVRCDEQLVISSAQCNKLKLRLDNRCESLKSQKLLWHGSLKKQSPRKNEKIARRYLILLSECILVCRESGAKLELKRELSIKDITIDVGENRRLSSTTTNLQNEQLNANEYYPFRVNAVEKSYEFVGEKESERDIWMKKISQATKDFTKQSTTIETRRLDIKANINHLGIRAPSWVNDIDVTRCQNCNNRFRLSIITSNRHHCRSCGYCVCGACSTKKFLLDYCKNQGEVRVCDHCYAHLTGADITKTAAARLQTTRDSDKTILSGYFRSFATSSMVWIELLEDSQLHIYGAKLDKVEDYSIKMIDIQELTLINETRTFTLQENNKSYKFSIEVNNQIDFPKNNDIDDKLKRTTNKLSFYVNLWFEGMQLARSKSTPSWYVRKRDSADSGVSGLTYYRK